MQSHFQILPQFIFNSRDPIVMGVIVEAGIVREGTPICVPSKGVSKIFIIRPWIVRKDQNLRPLSQPNSKLKH